ncbi:MAG: hypothetical protein PHT12_01205 [Patescibacteria group bacterium]|nr:hypothetical protein [Patescibacteria group bacterium]
MVPFLKDEAVWDGVMLVSRNVGAHENPDLVLDGYQYCTVGEYQLAILLKAAGVDFIPDVRFLMPTPEGKIRDYTPDFILREPWIWRGRSGHYELVHGFEAKRRRRDNEFPVRAAVNIKLLWEARRIYIKLMSDDAILRLYQRHLAEPKSCPLPIVRLPNL